MNDKRKFKQKQNKNAAKIEQHFFFFFFLILVCLTEKKTFKFDLVFFSKPALAICSISIL